MLFILLYFNKNLVYNFKKARYLKIIDQVNSFYLIQKTNENSLQQLSALLEAQQSSRTMSIPALPFYLRQKDMPEGKMIYNCG